MVARALDSPVPTSPKLASALARTVPQVSRVRMSSGLTSSIDAARDSACSKRSNSNSARARRAHHEVEVVEPILEQGDADRRGKTLPVSGPKRTLFQLPLRIDCVKRTGRFGRFWSACCGSLAEVADLEHPLSCIDSPAAQLRLLVPEDRSARRGSRHCLRPIFRLDRNETSTPRVGERGGRGWVPTWR